MSSEGSEAEPVGLEEEQKERGRGEQRHGGRHAREATPFKGQSPRVLVDGPRQPRGLLRVCHIPSTQGTGALSHHGPHG